ncbi:hypothetical protein [Mycoplasma seminis]|uniref:Uncharacterized protein n=1 Tax=Mycoplasma seminis TaxID=512749 RepID=A0ABY9H9Q4_9MOLU|nr:hypothetical protein [Mycoplasma seminis]WLP85307.1 hypothetical protein Q8852_03215 [Mycoplasma seminis]
MTIQNIEYNQKINEYSTDSGIDVNSLIEYIKNQIDDLKYYEENILNVRHSSDINSRADYNISDEEYKKQLDIAKYVSNNEWNSIQKQFITWVKNIFDYQNRLKYINTNRGY